VHPAPITIVPPPGLTLSPLTAVQTGKQGAHTAFAAGAPSMHQTGCLTPVQFPWGLSASRVVCHSLPAWPPSCPRLPLFSQVLLLQQCEARPQPPGARGQVCAARVPVLEPNQRRRPLFLRDTGSLPQSITWRKAEWLLHKCFPTLESRMLSQCSVGRGGRLAGWSEAVSVCAATQDRGLCHYHMEDVLKDSIRCCKLRCAVLSCALPAVCCASNVLFVEAG
jgi:hypothetical protein